MTLFQSARLLLNSAKQICMSIKTDFITIDLVKKRLSEKNPKKVLIV